VTFVFEKLQEGRWRGGRCAVSGRERKSGARCIRYDYAGKVTGEGIAGVNTFPFSGFVSNGPRLGAGRYRLTVHAFAAPDLVSTGPVRFRIT